ncbi:hypothetical protein FACS189496_4910 [Bacilli bacterium]|nr:hypothetical protein FACS189496_4910 [Bacilli bacterium]
MNASNITDKTGIAGGFGIDRIAMIKYGISDVRELFKGDFRLLTKLSNQGGNR